MRLTVVTLSDAFESFWERLGADLEVGIERVGPADFGAPGNETVAVVVAAGGAEQAAASWVGAHRLPPGMPLLVVGTDPARRAAMQIVMRGATDYFAFPDDLEIFRNAVASAVRGATPDGTPSGGPPDPFAAVVGRSETVKRVLRQAARLLPHRNARILILGETGTGKELLARAIHAGGPRGKAPFVSVNCSAFPEHLIESELFGHERGAFTDAHAAKPGLFEVADGGTLFLDEIGELPLGLQAKLLRALEEREIRRVGGTRGRTVDVRIMAATHEDLATRVRAGTFRGDLLYRLSTITLTLPPLRERGEDVLLIAETLLAQLAGEHGLPVPALTEDVRHRLREHPWPGNVRELKNALERGMLLSPPGELRADEIALEADSAGRGDGAIPFPAALCDITTAAARATLAVCDGNRRGAARQLGISPRRLRRLLAGRDPAAALEDAGDDEEAIVRDPARPRNGLQYGFTILELVTAVMIMGTATAAAVPKLVTLYNATSSRTVADAFVRSLELSRVTAVRMGRVAMLHIDAGQAAFWVDVDSSGTGQRDTIGGVRRYADRGVSVASADSLLCFDMRGLRSTHGGCQSGTATVVFSRPPRVDTVQVTLLGKAIR